MRGHLYQTNTIQAPSVLGPAPAGFNTPSPNYIIPFVMRWRSSFEQLLGPAVGALPLTILAITQEEGVDYPFFTRGVQPFNPPLRKRRNNSFYSVQTGATVILDAVGVDTFPLFLRMPTELPEAIKWRRRKLVSRIAQERANPAFIQPRLPAQTYSRTLCQVLREIQRHLLEPFPELLSESWQLWTKTEATDAFNRRLVKFLEDTGLTRERRTLTVLSGQVDVDLPSDTLSLRRAAFSDGVNSSPLTRVDKGELEGTVDWEQATGTPYAYIGEPFIISLYPIPDVGGTLEISIVAAPSPLSGCDPIPLPACFVMFVKWGTIADLLRKEGEGNDPERAKYAEGRFQEGVELARLLLGTEV